MWEKINDYFLVGEILFETNHKHPYDLHDHTYIAHHIIPNTSHAQSSSHAHDGEDVWFIGGYIMWREMKTHMWYGMLCCKHKHTTRVFFGCTHMWCTLDLTKCVWWMHYVKDARLFNRVMSNVLGGLEYIFSMYMLYKLCAVYVCVYVWFTAFRSVIYLIFTQH